MYLRYLSMTNDCYRWTSSSINYASFIAKIFGAMVFENEPLSVRAITVAGCGLLSNATETCIIFSPSC